MTQQITLIKDKILSDNYFTLHNITYDLTRRCCSTVCYI
jgi:GDP-mannose pyrophosphatase NudK